MRMDTCRFCRDVNCCVLRAYLACLCPDHGLLVPGVNPKGLDTLLTGSGRVRPTPQLGFINPIFPVTSTTTYPRAGSVRPPQRVPCFVARNARAAAVSGASGDAVHAAPG